MSSFLDRVTRAWVSCSQLSFQRAGAPLLPGRHACPGAVGSARASQTGELKPAQTRLMEWPLKAASSQAPPSALAQLPGLLEALGRMEACAGQAARMQALLSCQEVRSKTACCLLSMAVCSRSRVFIHAFQVRH